MKSFVRFPVYFLIAGMAIGLMLRWHFVLPIDQLPYMNWLHAHSHTMFLGWVFNMLIAAFTVNYIPPGSEKSFKKTFGFIQVLLLGMMVSFPLQGYGVFSITLLVLHMAAGSFYGYLLFRHTRWIRDRLSVRLMYGALLFFLISSLGALAVGPLAAAGLQGSKWYFYAIYFYLHFQYNGVFMFGLLALFFQLLEHHGVAYPLVRSARMAWILFFACFPSYLLSVLWGDSPWWVILFASAAAILQVVSFGMFWQIIRRGYKQIRNVVTPSAGFLFLLSLSAYALKIVLQAISAFPTIAVLASQVRFFVVAYLHLVLIGVVTLFLFGWLIQKKIVADSHKTVLILTVAAFIASEVIMILVPLLGSYFFFLSVVLLIFSIILASGFAIMALRRPALH